MLYPQEIIEQVIEANNIVDVISGYVKLTKKGSTYFGLCPFHNEKTPSFSVTDNGDKRMYYCFGCHAGGSVITFLMKYENYSYKEAVKVLADRAGIALPQPVYSREETEKNRKKEQILSVYKDAAYYYYYLLKSQRGQMAYQYLQKRQLSEKTIRDFGLGYSDKYRDDLYRYVKSKGYTDEILKETGLFAIRERGVYDYFYNRVMFPIMDTRNRVIAFGGRVMGDGQPKYLNSPESPVFEKRKTLYGLHIARRHKGSELILCEGYMDVISLHQAGFSNAVASLGTALTASHAAVLKKYTSKVVLSYDSDSAGKNAALRAIPILRDAGLQTRVIDLAPYKDPDELIKAEGSSSYEERLQKARNGFLFEIDMLSGSYDLKDPQGQTDFYNETAKRISRFSDEIERENYLKSISRQFHLDYQLLKDRTLWLALHREGSDSYEPVPEMRRPVRKELQAGAAESQKMLLSYLADHPSFYHRIEHVLEAKDFVSEPYASSARILFEQLRRGKVSISAIIGSFDEEEMQEEAAGIFSPSDAEPEAGELQRLLNDCVIRIKRNSLSRQLEEETDLTRVLQLKKEQEQFTHLDLFA
ncbi:MAG: DNA primase [Parasporobacterium sp.]|nr:DNA primase [Parasporobacterium sp.]